MMVKANLNAKTGKKKNRVRKRKLCIVWNGRGQERDQLRHALGLSRG